MKVDALSQHSPGSRSLQRLGAVGGQLLGNFERGGAITLGRGAHEVHEAARAKRAR